MDANPGRAVEYVVAGGRGRAVVYVVIGTTVKNGVVGPL